MDEIDCSICYEKLNKSTRKPITCPSCSVSACATCIKRFLLDGPLYPECMHCRHQWNDEFLRSNLPPSWVNKEYKLHREKVLLDSAKARVAETQIFIEVMNRQREIQTLIKSFHKNISVLEEQIRETNALCNEQRRLHTNLNRFIKGEIDMNPLDNFIPESERTERKQFIMPCPLGECKGFLSSAYKCGLCGKKICKDCHVEKTTDDHVCDQQIKESLSAIKKDSKTCPSCGTNIFKISGCDQMWCTQCNTAFSWKTGKIMTEGIHNPHYFEWLRNNGQDTAAALNRNRGGNCGNGYQVDRRLPNKNNIPKINNLARLIRHIIRVEIPQYNTGNRADPNRDIRIAYLVNTMSETDFKTTLQKRERNRAKKHQLHSIFTMFVQVADDLFGQYLNATDKVVLEEIMKQLEALRKYVNTSFENTYKQFQTSTVLVIDIDFKEIHKCKIKSKEYAIYANNSTPDVFTIKLN